MKNKLFVLSLLTAVFAVGCSESAYTPGNGQPVYNTGMPMNNNMGNNQPFLNNQNPQFMNQQGMPMYPAYQQQNMLSWSMRMRMPGFYYNNYQYRSCIPRKPYTTTCTQRTVRRNCPYVITTTSTTADNNTAVNTSTAVDTSTSVVTDTGDDTTKVYPISWSNDDAKALYDRLAKEEETVEKDKFLNKGVRARTGENYKCIVDGKESRAKNYVCDLEVSARDGMLLQQTPIGKDGQPVNTSSTMYNGDLLNIGVPGEAPEVGYLTIAGPVTEELFKNLKVEAIEGKVAEAGNVDAKIKTLGQIKCYKTTKSISNITECLIKIESNTGKALNF